MPFGPGEIVLVVVLAVLLFGGWRKLPELARAAGRSMRIVKAEVRGLAEDDLRRKGEPRTTRGPLGETPRDEA